MNIKELSVIIIIWVKIVLKWEAGMGEGGLRRRLLIGKLLLNTNEFVQNSNKKQNRIH